jgi:hypothetical protein
MSPSVRTDPGGGTTDADASAEAAPDRTGTWPSLRTFDAAHLQRISLPIGGIGTGVVGLGGRGDLRDFELGNRPAKGFRPQTAFVAVRAKPEGGAARAQLAEGPLPVEAYEGAFGSPAPHHGLPRFPDCSFEAAYPLGQVVLSDPDFPVQVRIQGFNPLVFGHAETSSIPVAVLRYRLHNPATVPVETTVAFSLSNFIGADGTRNRTGDNRNDYREATGLTGVVLSAPGLPDDAEENGVVALAVLTPPGTRTSHRTGWADLIWGNSLLDFWDDLLDDGALSERDSAARRPVASLAATVDVPGGGSADVTFLLTWNFPNRRAWSMHSDEDDAAAVADEWGENTGHYGRTVIGNAYSVAHPDPWQTAITVAGRLPDLEQATVAAVRAVVDTDVPAAIREAALSNLSTLRSQTVFASAAGDYYGWEGVGNRSGSCHGTCTHVWGYEFATSLLFAPIARSFRTTQYARSTDESGLMSFRTGLPVEQAREWRLAAADGQMACVVHLYLDWRLSGDPEFLAALWPAARRSLEFCWIPGGWDADRDGVMEGVQHNTMDVEYYGPNPQMGSWYLAALRAAEEMATAVGETDFAAYCGELLRSGSAWLDEHLFNGSYYVHQVRPVADPATIAPGLRHESMGAGDTANPDLQLANGCLVDQLVGQYAADVVGLGSLLDPDHVASALRAVHDRNFRRGFGHHFNPMRSFVLGNESGTLMATYDGSDRPERPFPYFSEVMTGFEYTAATGLLQAGDTAAGLEMIGAIRERYDGARRNPFDEAECGRHYARALASWSAFAHLNGTSYDGRTRTLFIEDRPGDGPRFWSTGTAFGTFAPREGGGAGTLRVVNGTVDLERIVISGTTRPAPEPHALGAGSIWVVR